VIQDLNARLPPDGMAFGRLSRCCSTRTIGDLRLISDEIIARLANEGTIFQPGPYLGDGRWWRRCLGFLRCLLLVPLPATMPAADLCMGRCHCAEEQQQGHRQPTPRKTRPRGVAWWSAPLDVTHPYHLRSETEPVQCQCRRSSFEGHRRPPPLTRQGIMRRDRRKHARSYHVSPFRECPGSSPEPESAGQSGISMNGRKTGRPQRIAYQLAMGGGGSGSGPSPGRVRTARLRRFRSLGCRRVTSQIDPNQPIGINCAAR
jgi:hypothetical protein